MRMESQPVHLECCRKEFSHVDGQDRTISAPRSAGLSHSRNSIKRSISSGVNCLFSYQEAQFGQARRSIQATDAPSSSDLPAGRRRTEPVGYPMADYGRSTWPYPEKVNGPPFRGKTAGRTDRHGATPVGMAHAGTVKPQPPKVLTPGNEQGPSGVRTGPVYRAPGRPCTCISPQEAGRLTLDHQRTTSHPELRRPAQDQV